YRSTLETWRSPDEPAPYRRRLARLRRGVPARRGLVGGRSDDRVRAAGLRLGARPAPDRGRRRGPGRGAARPPRTGRQPARAARVETVRRRLVLNHGPTVSCVPTPRA